MKKLILLGVSLLSLHPLAALADARIMNPGEAKGQLIYLSEQDVRSNSPKFQTLSPISIPVFAELPMDMSVVAGSITLKQQNLLSHVQLKSRARKTPNLDISALEGGLQSDLMKPFHDGDFVHMLLTQDGRIVIEPSTEKEVVAFYQSKVSGGVKLVADLSATKIYRTEELGWQDYDKVGSKAANYGELARLLNSPERTVVRPGFAIPFHYYQEFIETNPAILQAVTKILRDPLMNRVAKSSYREEKLKALQALILSDQAVVNPYLVDALLKLFDTQETPSGHKRSIKLRSSTNSEDLPNFNGAGLYSSEAYKAEKDGKEKSRDKKEKSLKDTLKLVWASIWTLRAWDERTYFSIPHADVKMGMQVNPTFGDEHVDGVVVTKNMAHRPEITGPGVFIELQRGDKISVANPEQGARPGQILVQYEASQPLNKSLYRINILQRSNVADDGKTILPTENPSPMMYDEEIKDLAYQAMKAHAHFKPLLGRDMPDFALDMEFKVDSGDTGKRQVYLKQARPYIE